MNASVKIVEEPVDGLGPASTYFSVRHNPFPSMNITVLGKSNLVGEAGWRLGNLLEPGRTNPRAISVIAGEARFPHVLSKPITTVFAPIPDFSCDILEYRYLTRIYPLGQAISICRGRQADGFNFPPGTAGAYATGGCVTLVAMIENKGDMWMCHCARKTLVPPALLKTSDLGTGTGSVLDNLFYALTSEQVRTTKFALVAGIGPNSYLLSTEDPEHGPANRKLIQFVQNRYPENWKRCFPEDLSVGRFSLPLLAQMELERRGVPSENIWHDGVDTGSDHNYYCHSKRGDGRNLVLALNPGW